MLVTAIINSRLQRDFAKEMSDSFKIKDKEPFGEAEIKRMLQEKKNKPDD